MKDIQLFFQLRIEASSVTLVDTFMNRSDSRMDFKGPISLFNCSFLNCARPKTWKIFVNLREIGKAKEKLENFEKENWQISEKIGKFEGKCRKISNGDQKIAENLRKNWKSFENNWKV